MDSFPTHSARLLIALALMLIVGGCGSNPRFAETFDAVPEPPPSPGNVLTRTDIERYPTAHSLEHLLMQAYSSMASGIRIRGMGPPLFVVDNVPTNDSRSVLATSTRDIDRVELVRDGGATALYGFRGSNGAIVITLRR